MGGRLVVIQRERQCTHPTLRDSRSVSCFMRKTAMWVFPAPVSSAMTMFRLKLSSSISCWYPRVSKVGTTDDGDVPSVRVEASSCGIWIGRQVAGIIVERKGCVVGLGVTGNHRCLYLL